VKDRYSRKKHSSNKDNSDGSVWTSFSDLFTSLAIIFLVMFVVTIIKLSLTNVESENFKNAHITEVEKEDALKKQENIASSISLINSKMAEIGELTGSLTKHKEDVDQLIKNQLRKDGQINIAKKVIEEKSIEIKDLAEKKVEMEQQIGTLIQAQEQLNVKLVKMAKIEETLNTSLSQQKEEIKIAKLDLVKKSNLTQDLEKTIEQLNKKHQEMLVDLRTKQDKETFSLKKQHQNKVQEQSSKISELLLKERELASKISDLDSSHSQLDQKNKNQQREIQEFQANVLDKEKTIKNLDKSKSRAESDISQLQEKLEGLDENLKVTSEKHQSALSSLRESQKENSENLSKISNLEHGKEVANKNFSGLNRELNEIKGKYQNTSGKYRDTLNSLNSRNEELIGLKNQNGDLGDKNGQLNGLLSSSTKDMEQCSLDRNKLKTKLSGLNSVEDDNRKLRQDLITNALALNKVDKMMRVPASVGETCQSVKCLLAKNIKDKLNKSDIDVKLDNQGKLILQMDDTFGFNNDSSKLKPTVKELLRTIILAYSEELLESKTIRDQIENIFIVGHASPRYKGDPIDLNGPNFEAYQHNLNLSIARSISIVNFIFGEEMGEFQYRNFFRQKLFTSGKGYTSPIALNKDTKKNGCGIFDCRKSRRVEIFFTLKSTNKDVLKKLSETVK
jgi:chromosome segregation ATPase